MIMEKVDADFFIDTVDYEVKKLITNKKLNDNRYIKSLFKNLHNYKRVKLKINILKAKIIQAKIETMSLIGDIVHHSTKNEILKKQLSILTKILNYPFMDEDDKTNDYHSTCLVSSKKVKMDDESSLKPIDIKEEPSLIESSTLSTSDTESDPDYLNIFNLEL